MVKTPKNLHHCYQMAGHKDLRQCNDANFKHVFAIPIWISSRLFCMTLGRSNLTICSRGRSYEKFGSVGWSNNFNFLWYYRLTFNKSNMFFKQSFVWSTEREVATAIAKFQLQWILFRRLRFILCVTMLKGTKYPAV